MPKTLTPRTLTPGNDGTVPVAAQIALPTEARNSYNSLEVPLQAIIDVLGFLQTRVSTLGDAAALLAKLRTVDGQGSLLDADLLDGKSSADLVSPDNLGFTQQLGVNGFTKLPNGLLIQWGKVDFGNGAYSGGQFVQRSFSWPTPFPAAVYSTTTGILSGLAAGTHSSVSCEGLTLTGAQMTLAYGANVTLQPIISFLAVGR